MNDIDYNAPSKVKNAARKCKRNWDQNKKLYIGLGIGAAVGAISVLVLKKNSSIIQNAIATSGPALNQVGRDITNNITINEEPVKRLSYIIKWGDEYFETQRAAAEAIGVSEMNLSMFLNGKKEHLGIDLFDIPVRLGVRSE